MGVLGSHASGFTWIPKKDTVLSQIEVLTRFLIILSALTVLNEQFIITWYNFHRIFLFTNRILYPQND